VAGCRDSVSLWDIAARRQVARLTSPRCPLPGQVIFSPDGTTLAIDASFGHGTYLYHAATRNQAATLPYPNPAGQYHFAARLAFSPDGTMLAVDDLCRQRPHPDEAEILAFIVAAVA
jgi:hypothetical protein